MRCCSQAEQLLMKRLIPPVNQQIYRILRDIVHCLVTRHTVIGKVSVRFNVTPAGSRPLLNCRKAVWSNSSQRSGYVNKFHGPGAQQRLSSGH